MAHRLAELMERADATTEDAGREATRKEATDLVLRLWDHRSSWPHGWPPEASAAIAGVSLRSRRASEDATGSPWLDSLEELDSLQLRERQIWINLGLLDFDVDAERRVVEELVGEDEAKERRAIESVIGLWDAADGAVQESMGAEIQSPTSRANTGLRQLEGVEQSRDELRRRLIGQIAGCEHAE